MQTALFRIWTQVAESASYDNNCYTMSASIFVKLFSCKYKKNLHRLLIFAYYNKIFNVANVKIVKVKNS